MSIRIWLVFLLLVQGYLHSANASDITAKITEIPLQNFDTTKSVNIIPYSYWLLDYSDNQDVNEVLAANNWKVPVHSNSLSLGYTQATLWLAFRIDTRDVPNEVVWLQIKPTFLDQISLFTVLADGQILQQRSGDHLPFYQRDVLARNMVLPLNLSGEGTFYLLKINTGSALTAMVNLISPSALLFEEKNETLLFGVLFGLMLISIIFSVLIGIWLKRRFYFYVACYLLSSLLFLFCLNGFDQIYFYPKYPFMSDRFLGVFGFAGTGFFVIFVLQFLELKRFFQRSYLFLLGLSWLSFTGAVFSLAGFYPLLAVPLMLLTFTAFFISFIVFFRYFKVNAVAAWLMLITFCPGVIAIQLQILRNLGFLPYNFFTTHLWAFSMMLQTVFTVLVMVLKVREQQQAAELEQKQRTALKEFYNLMAHELRTPVSVLSSVLSNLELQVAKALPGQLPRVLKGKAAVGRLVYLINNTLAEVRLAELKAIQLETIHVASWLDEVKLQYLSQDDCPVRVVDAGESVSFNADKSWLTLALLNLLDNAAKYAEPADEVVLLVSERDDWLSFYVSNAGPEIPFSQVADLFQRGRRLPQHQKHSGLGLGLYLVKLIAEAHNGSVSYQHVAGNNIFSLSVPQDPSAVVSAA